MKVLIIGSVWPEPASSAAGGRMAGHLRLFKRQGWEVTYATPAAPSAYALDLEALGVEKKTIAMNHGSFDDFLLALRPTLVLFDRFMVEEQFGWRVAEICPEAMRVLDTVDLHFLRKARHAALIAGREPLLSDLQSDTAKREIASLLRCDMSLIVSEYERELLANTFKIDSGLLYYYPLLVPAIGSEWKNTWPAFEARKDFVFIGNFMHEPNWDAVLYLKQAIWPRLSSRLPGVKLHVYGAYPSPKAFALHHAEAGFFMHGRADNSRQAMSEARVCLAPIRFGAGVKGKLVEAMICGTPSVTTPIGAEGLQSDFPWSGAVAHDPDSIAEAAARLYSDKDAWMMARENGVAIVNRRNAEHLFESGFVADLLRLQEELTQRRGEHFLGSVLRHQTLNSTKYMSKWIEEKNRHKPPSP